MLGRVKTRFEALEVVSYADSIKSELIAVRRAVVEIKLLSDKAAPAVLVVTIGRSD